jgi:hypothetical protein
MDPKNHDTFGYRDSCYLKYDNVDNFGRKANEHVGSLTFVGVSFNKR